MPVRHGSRWRIRWLDEHGRRKSAVYDDYKQAQLEERLAGKLVMLRTKDSDALCAEVVRQRRAIVIADAARDGRIAADTRA